MTNDKKDSRTLLAAIAARVALAAGIAAAVLSILMIVNSLQVRSVDPLHSKALETLEARLETDPDDESLKEEIRALDLLARKAYFTHRWQIRTGSYILFAFILLFLIAQKYRASLRPALPDLTKEEESAEMRSAARRFVEQDHSWNRCLSPFGELLGCAEAEQTHSRGKTCSRTVSTSA